MARLAKALDRLRSQVDALHPNRSKRSDGWIGDAAHAGRTSDHNPNRAGVVTAIDLTHDPDGGFNAHQWAREVLAASNDDRIEYIISNGQIWRRGTGWRTYRGANPHSQHVHVSVHNTPTLYDANQPWQVGVRVVVDGNKPVPGAVMMNGTTMVPVRALCEAAGLTVTYDADTSTVAVTTRR